MQPDDKTSNRLVDMILDKAGAKGTGKWTSQDSMDLGIPVPVIDMAVSYERSFRSKRRTHTGIRFFINLEPMK